MNSKRFTRMLTRKNWMLLPEYEQQRSYKRKITEKNIIGLDVETDTDYPQNKIFMVQIYSKNVKRVFYPDSARDMKALAMFLFRNRNSVISCFNTMFDMARMFYCIGQNVDWVTEVDPKDEERFKYTWKVDKTYPMLHETHPELYAADRPYCLFDAIPMPMPDMVKKVDVRVKWCEKTDPKGRHNTMKSHECTWMFGSVAQAAPFLDMKKLDRSIAVLNDNERARWLVANRDKLKTKEDKKDLKYLIDYGMADAEIAYKAAKLQQRVLPISIGANSPAAPARALIKDARLHQAPTGVMDDAWKAYFGGISLMIDRGVHHRRTDCNIFDFLSFYPSTIKNLKLMNLDHIDAKGFDWDVPKKVSDTLDFEYHYCVHAKVKGLVMSKEIVHWDGIPKLIPITGEFEGWFWDCELPFLEVIDYDDIHFFAYMRKSYLQEKIEKMLLKRAQMRSSDPQRLGYKILLNSVYGVLCQHTPKAGAAFNAHRGSLLTSMCRSTLMDTIMRNLDKAIMCDTDSLAVVGEPRYDKKLMRLDFHKNIAFKDWTKETNYYFQKEFTFRDYIAVRLKRYMMIKDWVDGWTFSDYIKENKRIAKRNADRPNGQQKEQKVMKYAYHATTISPEFMDKVFDYITGHTVDVPEKYMMAFRQTYKRWLSDGKMEMIGGFTKAKEIISNLDFGNYMDNWINDDHKLFRDRPEFTDKQRGRFHTPKSLKQFTKVRPYVQDLRKQKDKPEKRAQIYDMMINYGANAEEWVPEDPDKNLAVLQMAQKNMFDKKQYSSG